LLQNQQQQQQKDYFEAVV